MKTHDATLPASVVFLHSSNEMYGADKILLEVLTALPPSEREQASVWLPDDIPAGKSRLSDELDARGAAHVVGPLPVLRRRYLSLPGLWPLAARLWKTFRKLRAVRPEVVYCTTSAMVLCLVVARLAGVKHIVLHMQEIWSPREGAVLGLFGRGAHRIFCISAASRNSLPSHLQSRADLLVNAHNASPGVASAVAAHQGPLSFVVASRWNSWKGHATLLAAWDGEHCPGELVVLGGPPVMGRGVDVASLVRAVKHAGSISVVGEVDDIVPYIDAADFLVLPSDKPEPFGLVVLEAFARGRPVIASGAGGVLDMVSDGRNGRLFAIGQPNDLLSVLGSLDREQAVEMGFNARKTYEARFSINAFQTRFQDLWSSLKDSGNGGEGDKG